MAKKKGFVVDYNNIEKQIWQMAEPIVRVCGAELIDVEYVLEAGSWYLRIYLDRETPVDHDLCEMVSEKVSAALDIHDPIEQSYYLEISSPGLERPLKREEDFVRYAGQEIMVRLYSPKDGSKEFAGILGGMDERGLILIQDGKEICFDLNEVAKAHLVADI